MSLTHNTTTITGLTVDGVETKQMTLDGNPIWAKRYTLTISQSNISGISYKLTVNRTARTDPSVSTGSSDVTGSPTSYTIYYGETISFTVTATNATSSTSATPLKNNTWSGTVSGNITITPEKDLNSLLPATMVNCSIESADDEIRYNENYSMAFKGDTVTVAGITVTARFNTSVSVRSYTGCSVSKSIRYGSNNTIMDVSAYITSSNRSISVEALYQPVVVALRWNNTADEDNWNWDSTSIITHNRSTSQFGYISGGYFYFFIGILYIGETPSYSGSLTEENDVQPTQRYNGNVNVLGNYSQLPTPFKNGKIRIIRCRMEIGQSYERGITASNYKYSGYTQYHYRSFEIADTIGGGWD